MNQLQMINRMLWGGAPSIPTDYFLYLDADNPLNTNERWFDLSPNNFLFNQTNTALQPQLISNAIGTNKAYRFNGDYFKGTFGQTFAQPYTIFTVWSRTGGSSFQSTWDGYGSNRVILYSNDTQVITYAQFALSYAKTAPFSPIISTSVFDNIGLDKIYEGTTLKNNGAAGQFNIDGMTIGANNSGGWSFIGDIGLILGYPKLLIPEELLLVQQFFMDKYGL